MNKTLRTRLLILPIVVLLVSCGAPGEIGATQTTNSQFREEACSVEEPVCDEPVITGTGTPVNKPEQGTIVPQPAAPRQEETVSSTDTAAPTLTQPPSATPDTRPDPADWQEWPVLPSVSGTAVDIYRKGIELGRDPHAISKIGDCQNVPSYFLGTFDKGDYTLGPDYEYLTPTIKQFAGSWERESEAVRGGFNVASVLSPMMADKTACKKGETPLDCEFRLHNPSIVIISMEQWWSKRPAEIYEGYLRQIVEYSIERGALPILATKADNIEGDHRINATIVKIAYEYDLPLWNFWLAVQPLPSHGIWKDGFHLTVGRNDFSDPKAMRNAWPVRNITALQAVDIVWQGVSGSDSQ